MDLSIIIVSFNTKELLRSCIDSVLGTIKNVQYEIIVVDNGSEDGSPEMIESEFKGVKLEKNGENVGFAKANNQAMKMATGKYVLLLNSDAIIKEKTMETLIKFMETHPRAAAVGPKIIHPRGTLQSKGEIFPYIGKSLLDLFRVSNLLTTETLYKLFPRYYWYENKTRSVDCLIGCCFLIRKAAMERIGTFSERFFLYGEESEWCYRAKKHDYEIWYVSEAEVFHLGEGSNIGRRQEWRLKGFSLFYEMTMGRMQGIVITVIDILFLYTRLLGSVLRSKKIGDYHNYKEQIEGELTKQRKLLRLLMMNRDSNMPLTQGKESVRV